MYLKDDSTGADFSIRDWVKDDTKDSWLFISSNQSLHAALRPLITLLIDTAINALLAMEPDFDRRLWFFIDELSSLNQLPSLFDAAERGRKKGLCLSLGLQSVNQLSAIYGPHKTNTLVSLCNTKLCFKTKDHNSAKWASSLFGNAEVLETKEGLSYGAHEMRDGVSIQEQKLNQAVVLPSEIMQLPNLSAFMQCGSWPVTKLEFAYKEQETHCNALELRDLTNINAISDTPIVTTDSNDSYQINIDL